MSGASILICIGPFPQPRPQRATALGVPGPWRLPPGLHLSPTASDFPTALLRRARSPSSTCPRRLRVPRSWRAPSLPRQDHLDSAHPLRAAPNPQRPARQVARVPWTTHSATHPTTAVAAAPTRACCLDYLADAARTYSHNPGSRRPPTSARRPHPPRAAPRPTLIAEDVATQRTLSRFENSITVRQVARLNRLLLQQYLQLHRKDPPEETIWTSTPPTTPVRNTGEPALPPSVRRGPSAGDVGLSAFPDRDVYLPIQADESA